MGAVVPIVRERIEVGRVTGNGDHEWMMAVLDGAETVDAGFYRSRAAAVAAAATWQLPIHFVHEVGSVRPAEAAI
jgi:hypothetical protein